MFKSKSCASALAMLVAGVTSAVADTVEFQVDQSHSYMGFEVDHFGFASTRGRFNEFDGTLLIDEENPQNSEVTFTVDTASIDTNHEARDEHLRAPDFFNVEQYPQMTFESTEVEVTGENEGKLTGDLTMLGETHPVTLDFVITRDAPMPIPAYNNVRTVGFEATGTIDRTRWGMETFAPAVGAQVLLDLHFDAVHCVGEAAEAPSCS